MTNDMDSSDNGLQQPEKIPQVGSLSANQGMPPASPPRRSLLRVAVSWFCILATVALTLISQHNLTKRVPDPAQDLSLQLMGKYVVGTKSLLGSGIPLKRNFESMKKTFQKYKNTQKELLVIPILVELSNKQEALTELRRLVENPARGDVHRDASIFLQLYQDGDSSLDPQQRLSIERYGWLGRLALSQSKVTNDPERVALLQSALKATIAIVAFILGILGAMVAGLILFVLAIVFRVKGRLCNRLTIPEIPGISLLEAFAIYLTGFLALPKLVVWLFPGYRLGTIWVGIPAVIIAAIWPYFRESGWKNYRTAIGWYRGQGFFREIGAGILGYIAGLPLLLGAAISVGIISRYTDSVPMHPIVYEIGRGPMYLVFWAVAACIWAPIVEETFFRGALFGYLRRHLGWAVSGILTALLFAIIHPQGWIGVPLIAAIGFTNSAIREWRGSIIASMSSHALNNTSAMLFLIVACR
jgi:membrane protease YdiL (CAAX protease family)